MFNWIKMNWFFKKFCFRFRYRIRISAKNASVGLPIRRGHSNPGISQRQTCQIYDVTRSTLQARLQNKPSTQTYHASTQRLLLNEEQILITWIERMTSWKWPFCIQQFEYIIKELLMVKNDKIFLKNHYYQNFLK